MNLASDDLDLVRRALRRDDRALHELGRRLQCVPRILAARNARVGRPLGDEDVLEAAHEVIARVWAQLGEFRGQAALESWVYRFCEFELINAVRRKRRAPRPVDEAELVGPDIAPAVDVERVYSSIDRLTRDEAVVVRSKHFDDLTFEEIADRDQVPLATVKSRYYRGLEKLRYWLTPLREGEHG
ncbi:MAG: sigma-70 family RNA polymerase sigma factor [Planctomycetota bacterium]